jgi:Fur family transcriptional regulator, ferric uptake regulator
MNDPLSKQMEDRFAQYLRSAGMSWNLQRRTALRALFRAKKPVTARELAYIAKEENASISSTTVYRIVKLLVASGVAVETKSADGFALYGPAPTEPCSHAHLVCKDCGAVVKQE